MHYRNGRVAKNGDKVVMFPSYGGPVVGILYDAVAGNDFCNGKIAPTSPTDPMPNLKEVLHWDDVKAASENAPDTSIPVSGICVCNTQGEPAAVPPTTPPPADAA